MQRMRSLFRRVVSRRDLLKQAHFLLICLVAAVTLLFFAERSALALGSNLQGVPNAGWGCETALIFNPITGVPQLAATGQTTCTIRNTGYISSFQVGSYVPQNGFVTTVRIKSGNNPAPVRVTIMQCSPGRVGCTAKSFSRTLRPRANRVSTFVVNMRVLRSVSKDPINGVINVTDAVALSAVGPGSLPLSLQGTTGTYAPGSSLTQFWWPLTQRGQLRNEDAYNVDGIELLLRWSFSRTRPDILR